MYCDPIPLPRLLYCNTTPAHCNTNHPTTHPKLQYKFSITIQLGSSPSQFSAPIFFFRFSSFFFLYIYLYWKMPRKKIHLYNFFSHFFQLLEDTQKNIPIYFFFSFSTILKSIYKNLFYSIFFNFTTCKTLKKLFSSSFFFIFL